MKKERDTIKSCSHTSCIRGTLCQNFNPRYVKNSFGFPSCMYNPNYIATKTNKVTNANK